MDSRLERLWRGYGNRSATASDLIVPRPARATGLHATPCEFATGASNVSCAFRADRRCDGYGIAMYGGAQTGDIYGYSVMQSGHHDLSEYAGAGPRN